MVPRIHVIKTLAIALVVLITAGCSKPNDPDPAPVVTEPGIQYSSQSTMGFTLKYPSTLDLHSSTASTAMQIISKHLDLLRNYFPYETLKQVQQLPVWLNESNNEQPVTYWGDGTNLPEKEKVKSKNVEILNLSKAANRLEGVEPGVLVYYFSLLQYDRLSATLTQRVLDAYNHAVSTGLYKQVKHTTETGVINENSPAIASVQKYFAKLSEAYFSESDFAPTVYEELEEYDPTGFQMMQAVWGPRRIKEYKEIPMRGFTVMINKSDESNATINEALGIIDNELKLLNDSVFAEGLAVLKTRPIWLSLNDGSAASFHPDKTWLLENGKLPEMAQCVQVTNATNFVAWSKVNQPWIILHELSHCMHYHVFGWENQMITAAYNNAVATGLYRNIPYINDQGATVTQAQGYALTNEKEYFAELTESFFAKNDYFPFNRQDLQPYDTAGYRVAKILWKR